jgi:hypothetical protein
LNRSKKTFSDNHFHPLQKIKCRDCGHTTKWYDMIEIRRTKALSAGVGEGGSLVVPSLQETLFATGGRETLIADDFGGDSSIINLDVNTPAGTHDGSDSTLDSVHHQDGVLQKASGHLERIDFLRWHLRGWHVDIVGNPTRQISGVYVETGFGATNTVATRSLAAISVPTDINLDVAINPATSQPWTAAAINARKAGFQLDSFDLNGVAGGWESQTLCSEFWLEVWGHR